MYKMKCLSELWSISGQEIENRFDFYEELWISWHKQWSTRTTLHMEKRSDEAKKWCFRAISAQNGDWVFPQNGGLF